MRSAAARRRAAAPIGAALVYRQGDRCPACWGSAFNIGRSTAECARCGTPLVLTEPSREAHHA